MNRPRLVLADDHKLVLDGFRRILEHEFDIVAAVEDGRALLLAAQELRPDAILVDISMPLLNGIDATRQLKRNCPEAKVLIVTMHSDQAYIVEAFRAGAWGYLLKRSRPSDLIAAIWAVLGGERYVTPGLGIDAQAACKRVDRTTSHTLPRLSARQREVLQLIAEGLSNKEIAGHLNVSVKVIEFHKAVLARKLRTKRSSELTRAAIAYGLVGSE